MSNATTTRSPGAKPVTASPTASTTPTASWPITSPGAIGAFRWKKCRSDPQIAARVTRTIASVGSRSSGSGTSSIRTRPASANTTARTASALVGERGRNLAAQMHEFVGRFHVPHDRGEITAHPQFALHHGPHRVEFAEHDVLPPGVGRADHVLRRLALLGIHEAAATARAVPQVEVAPGVLRHPAVGFGLDQERDVALPVLGG